MIQLKRKVFSKSFSKQKVESHDETMYNRIYIGHSNVLPDKDGSSIMEPSEIQIWKFFIEKCNEKFSNLNWLKKKTYFLSNDADSSNGDNPSFASSNVLLSDKISKQGYYSMNIIYSL